MKLKILGSNSSGNCYFLTSSSGEILILDCGVRFEKVKQALDFKLQSVKGILLTHSHGDHNKGIIEAQKNGLNVFCSQETAIESNIEHSHRTHIIQPKQVYQIGSFHILAFDVNHDVRCFGYMIKHPEMGTTLFITDTYYVKYVFPNINHFIVEANYSKNIIDENLSDKRFLRDRVLQSHMELQTTLNFLKAHDLVHANQIILIHLSESNSNATEFQKYIQTHTQVQTSIATAGAEFDMNLNPILL